MQTATQNLPGSPAKGQMNCAMHNVLIVTNWLLFVGNDKVRVYGWFFYSLVLTYLVSTSFILRTSIKNFFVHWQQRDFLLTSEILSINYSIKFKPVLFKTNLKVREKF